MPFVVELEEPRHGVDVEWLAQLHHDELGSSREFDREAVKHACIHCILDKERKYVNCWIAYDTTHQRPIGYLAATMRPSFYSKRNYAIQEMWYVLPKYRGTIAAIKLLQRFEVWALANHAERIYTQVELDDNAERVERTMRLMNKLGYRRQGYIAVKVIHILLNNEDVYNDRSTHREVGAGQTTAQS